MAIRILLFTLLALLIGSVWLGYERGPFKDLRFLAPAATREALEPYLEIPVLHQYRHGSHAYVGEVPAPSPCHLIDAQSIVRESYPEQVTVELKALPDPSRGDCALEETGKRFKVAFQASPEARISVLWNGKPATFIVTEVSSTSSLEAQLVY